MSIIRSMVEHASCTHLSLFPHCFPSPNLFHVVGVINTWGSAIFSCIVMEWDRNVWAFLLSKHCLMLWLLCFTLFYYLNFPVGPVQILFITKCTIPSCRRCLSPLFSFMNGFKCQMNISVLKGYMLSSFTHPYIIPNSWCCFFLWNNCF